MALPEVYELVDTQTLSDVPAEYDYAVDYRFENGQNGAPVYFKRFDKGWKEME